MVNALGRFGLGSVGALVLALSSGGCSGGSDPVEVDPEQSAVSELRSDAPRVVADASEAGRAADSQQRFGVDFFHALNADENLAFSPHSLSTAFAMAVDAGAGETLEEIQAALAFGSTDEAFHRSESALALGLAARNRAAIDDAMQHVDPQVLVQSNDIWIRDDAPPQQSFLDTLARFYGVGVHQADFEFRAEEARLSINSKVATDTRQLIQELLPEHSLDDLTVAVLTNALYFKAPWARQFAAPVPGTFVRADGSSIDVPMLHTLDDLDYYRGDDFFSVNVPYYGDDLEMLLIVPDSGAYASVRAELSAEGLSSIVTGRQQTRVDLTLPKFSVKSTVPATDVLKGLGIEIAFTKDAEFPKLTSPKFDKVYISNVFHQATVAIDEKGTEASAATAIVFSGVTSAPPEPPPPLVLEVDRPFLFAIRDNPTGAVLFLGQVVAP